MWKSSVLRKGEKMYEVWEENRQLALNLLKPSPKEIEHGLELHRNSLVFDAYGFIPGGGGKPERWEKHILENGSPAELKAAMEEFKSCTSFLTDPEMARKLQETLEYCGVDCIFQNAGVEGNDTENMLKRLSCFTMLTDRLKSVFERAVLPGDFEAIRARGLRSLCFTTNGVPLPSKMVSAEEALEHIVVFARFGVRMMHLTYNRRNLIGDGCAEKANGGLSDFGRMVVAEMNRVGIIPDVAHSGQQTSLETALCSTRPVVASHTVAGKLSFHYRGKCDEVIEAIKKSNGYVGICAIPRFLSGTSDIRAMMDHIEYVARKFGVDHVAIGTDRSTSLAPLETELKPFPARAIWEKFTPDPGDGGSKVTDEQFRSICFTNWPIFTIGLVQRGFKDEEIRKIIGGNVLRVLKDSAV